MQLARENKTKCWNLFAAKRQTVMLAQHKARRVSSVDPSGTGKMALAKFHGKKPDMVQVTYI